MSMKAFIKEVQKGLPGAAYLLYSSEPYLLKEAEFFVRAGIPEASRDFCFDVFDALGPAGSGTPSEQIVDVLHSVPLVGDRRVVVLENAQALKDLSAFERYVASPSPGALLVMLYVASGRGLKKSWDALRQGARSISVDLRESELPAWMAHRAAKLGFTFSGDAIEYLLGVIGPEPGLLASEIDKLSRLGRQTLARQDIEELVRGSGGYDPFDLVDALKKRDVDQVLAIYRALSETHDPQGLMGAINWHYSKTGMDSARAERVFAILHETDAALKSTGGYYPLEYALLRLLRV